jgi:hypothetical protein
MLQIPQCALDATKDPGHRTTRIAHVISLFIASFPFS